MSNVRDERLPTPDESEARLREVQAKIAARTPDATLAQWWSGRVEVASTRVMVCTDDRALTYGEFDTLVQRVANWGSVRGLESGDTVALQLPTGPAFLALILAMGELGVCMSLLGTGLRGASLECVRRWRPVVSVGRRVPVTPRPGGHGPRDHDGRLPVRSTRVVRAARARAPCACHATLRAHG
ncbi:MAG: AMP-binding protein [Actinobacteria bacterium]|nr:AMP-binding protein [Actinomycetota bacterium]MSX86424.1 AMP-binding protein [Actinomycetota bacterium]